MKLMPGLSIESGIDKGIIEGPIWVSKTGLEGDEHDLTFHGGPTKAVHACMWPISFLLVISAVRRAIISYAANRTDHHTKTTNHLCRPRLQLPLPNLAIRPSPSVPPLHPRRLRRKPRLHTLQRAQHLHRRHIRHRFRSFSSPTPSLAAPPALLQT